MLANQVEPKKSEDQIALAKDRFLEDIVHNNAKACNNVSDKDFDFELAKRKSRNNITALEADGGVQTLLASQMMSIHKIQQHSMAMANGLPYGEARQYFTNTAIKLANTFTQQANLLAKLQGIGGQKIIVERVDISNGGQAIIGTINSPEQ